MTGEREAVAKVAVALREAGRALIEGRDSALIDHLSEASLAARALAHRQRSFVSR